MKDRNTTILGLGDIGYTVAGSYLSVVAIVATLGNSLVVLTFIRNSATRRKCHNVLLLNLALADLGISFFGYPLVTVSTLAGRWMFHDVGCKTYAFTTFFFSMVSLNTLVCLSIYRYIIVCKPSYKHHLNKRTTFWTICSTWAYGLFWALLPFFGWSSYTYEAFGTSCTINWTNQGVSAISYDVTVIVTCFILHIAVLLFCYRKIIKRAQSLMFDQDASSEQKPPRCSEGFNIKYMRKQSRISMMCCVMVLMFLICWGPYAIFSFITIFTHVPSSLATIPTFLAKAAPMCNCIIYFFMNKRFRDTFFRTYCCCLNNIISPNDAANTFAKYYPNWQTLSIFRARPACNKEGVYMGPEPGDIYQCRPLQDELMTSSSSRSPLATIEEFQTNDRSPNRDKKSSFALVSIRLRASLRIAKFAKATEEMKNELPLLNLIKPDSQSKQTPERPNEERVPGTTDTLQPENENQCSENSGQKIHQKSHEISPSTSSGMLSPVMTSHTAGTPPSCENESDLSATCDRRDKEVVLYVSNLQPNPQSDIIDYNYDHFGAYNEPYDSENESRESPVSSKMVHAPLRKNFSSPCLNATGFRVQTPRKGFFTTDSAIESIPDDGTVLQSGITASSSSTNVRKYSRHMNDRENLEEMFAWL